MDRDGRLNIQTIKTGNAVNFHEVYVFHDRWKFSSSCRAISLSSLLFHLPFAFLLFPRSRPSLFFSRGRGSWNTTAWQEIHDLIWRDSKIMDSNVDHLPIPLQRHWRAIPKTTGALNSFPWLTRKDYSITSQRNLLKFSRVIQISRNVDANSLENPRTSLFTAVFQSTSTNSWFYHSRYQDIWRWLRKRWFNQNISLVSD